MISDFIEVNKIDGRLIEFLSDAPSERALKEARLSPNSFAKTFVFVDAKMDFYVVVAHFEEKINVNAAKKLFGVSKLSNSSEKDVVNLTGFSKDCFPPIGVFGVKIALHSSIINQNVLLFELSQREFLVIKRAEIVRAAELNESLF